MDDQSLDFALPSAEEVAELFPAYKDFLYIAKGGMSVVYKATQRNLERPVALKILPKELSADENYRELFHQEARVMAKLKHDSLISLYDFGQAGDYLFISMEYVNGKALHYSIYGEEIAAEVAGKITMDILAGLSEAHNNGVLHRDISPGNIFLDPDQGPKIGDFGLASSESEGAEDSAHGTPGYTAPEVVEAPEKLDHRADLFSTGIILYQMLSGLVPPEFELNGEGENVRADYPEEFNPIIQKAMAEDPADRYASADEMKDELEAVLSSLGHQEDAQITLPPPITRYLGESLKTAPLKTTQISSTSTPTPSEKPSKPIFNTPGASYTPPVVKRKNPLIGLFFKLIALAAVAALGYFGWKKYGGGNELSPEGVKQALSSLVGSGHPELDAYLASKKAGEVVYPQGALMGKNYWHYIVDTPKTREEAQAFAESYGGDLLAFTSRGVRKFMDKNLNPFLSSDVKYLTAGGAISKGDKQLERLGEKVSGSHPFIISVEKVK